MQSYNKDLKSLRQDGDCDADCLDRLAQSSDWLVKINVAEHKNCSPNTLENLARDESWSIRQAVAENPNTSNVTLFTLSKDFHSDVRLAVAQNANSNAEVLDVLSKDSASPDSWLIREAVARHPNASDAALEVLRSDRYNQVCQAALRQFDKRKIKRREIMEAPSFNKTENNTSPQAEASGSYTVANNSIAVEPFPTSQVEKEIRHGVAMVRQKNSLQPLKVIVGDKEKYLPGMTVWVKGDQCVANWAKEVFEIDGNKFVLLPKDQIVLFGTK